MKRGKQTCRILKEIRRQIAEANDIEFITSECQYQGECLGTCPKCEAEVRYLEQQLERKRLAGKAITVLGISAGLIALVPQTSCTSHQKPNNASTNDSITRTDTLEPTHTMEEMKLTNHTDADFPDTTITVELPHIPDSILTLLEESIQGDIPAPEPSTLPDTDTLDYFIVCENMPEFPGGNEALMKYLTRTITDTKPIAQGEKQTNGRVIIQFIIDKEGNVTKPHVVRSLDPYLDKEALRIVSLMPKWKPGIQREKPVAVQYTVPVSFRYQ